MTPGPLIQAGVNHHQEGAIPGLIQSQGQEKQGAEEGQDLLLEIGLQGQGQDREEEETDLRCNLLRGNLETSLKC